MNVKEIFNFFNGLKNINKKQRGILIFICFLLIPILYAYPVYEGIWTHVIGYIAIIITLFVYFIIVLLLVIPLKKVCILVVPLLVVIYFTEDLFLQAFRLPYTWLTHYSLIGFIILGSFIIIIYWLSLIMGEKFPKPKTE